MATIQPSIIAGPYSVTWNSTALGQVSDGFTIRCTKHFEPVTADAGGDATLNLVNRGEDWFVDMTLLEYGKALTANVISPGDTKEPAAAPNFPTGFMQEIGNDIVTNDAQVLELRPISPVVGNRGNATLKYKFYKAYPEGDISILLSSNFTQIPISFRIFPVGGTPYTGAAVTNDEFCTVAIDA